MKILAFNYQNYNFELYLEDNQLEIYCKETDFSGFGKIEDYGVVSIAVPMGPTFNVIKSLQNKGWTITVETTKLLVLQGGI